MCTCAGMLYTCVFKGCQPMFKGRLSVPVQVCDEEAQRLVVGGGQLAEQVPDLKDDSVELDAGPSLLGGLGGGSDTVLKQIKALQVTGGPATGSTGTAGLHNPQHGRGIDGTSRGPASSPSFGRHLGEQ